MTEYNYLIECDQDKPSIDPDKMSQEYIRKLEERHEANKQKRKEKGLTASAKDFING